LAAISSRNEYLRFVINFCAGAWQAQLVLLSFVAPGQLQLAAFCYQILFTGKLLNIVAPATATHGSGRVVRYRFGPGATFKTTIAPGFST
jgi:hypothetical protein